MLSFAHPVWLLLLLLVPLFPLLHALWLWRRARAVQKFGQRDLVEALMPSRSRSKSWVRVAFFTLGFAFLALGLARPRTGARLAERKVRGAEIVIALDVSNSMLAEDYSPNRLERAKLAISRLTDRLQDDRIGLVVFAGTAFVQLPVTSDYVSAKQFLSNVDTKSVPVQGTAMGDAISLCVKSFSAQSEKSRVVIVISDGENHEDDPVSAAQTAASVGVKVYTIGVGSAEGQPVPMDGQLLRDNAGEIVVTHLDEATLRAVAEAGGGRYIHARGTDFGLDPIVRDIRAMEDEEMGSVVFEEYDEQFMGFLGVALFFFVLELLVGERKSRRRLFVGGGVALWLLCLFPCPSAWGQTKEIRRGNRAYAKGDYAAADGAYRAALAKDSTLASAHYNLGNDLFRQGKMEEAEAAYRAALSHDGGTMLSPDICFGAGRAAMQREDWASALRAFRHCMRLDPNDMEAKQCYAYVRGKMQGDQNNQGSQGDQGNQGNQGDQGDQGNQGDPGDQNNQGNQGDQGNSDNSGDQGNPDNAQSGQDDSPKNKGEQNDRDTPQSPTDGRERQAEGGKPGELSARQAGQMLQAIQDKEEATRQKVEAKRAQALRSRRKQKNW